MLKALSSALRRATMRAYNCTTADCKKLLGNVQAWLAEVDAGDRTLDAFVGSRDLPTITTPPACQRPPAQRRLATTPTAAPVLAEFEATKQIGRPKGDGRAFPNTQELRTSMEVQLRDALSTVQKHGTPQAAVDTSRHMAAPVAGVVGAQQAALLYGPPIALERFLQLQYALMPIQTSGGAAAEDAKRLNDAVLEFYNREQPLPKDVWGVLERLGVKTAGV